MKKILLFTVTAFILFSCSSSGNNGERDTSLLPMSAGAPGEIVVSMDSLQWKGELGAAVRKVLLAEVPGVPREELLFTVRYVQPEKMNNSLKQVSNIIYVTTFDAKGKGARVVQGFFTPESKQKAQESDTYFLTTMKDLYARDQSIMYLFGRTEDELIKNIDSNSSMIVDHFNRRERSRLEEKIFKKREKGIEESITQNFGIKLKIPFGYQLAMIKDNFIWIRQIDRDIDKSIIIWREPYTDLYQFEQDTIIGRRDRIAKRYLYEDKDNKPDSYVETETSVPYIPVTSRQINVNGSYAIETRGLWRTHNLSMGGPFLGTTIVDESSGYLYYVEGFVFSPGKDQRETIREFEAIIHSFETLEKAPE